MLGVQHGLRVALSTTDTWNHSKEHVEWNPAHCKAAPSQGVWADQPFSAGYSANDFWQFPGFSAQINNM